MLMSLKNKKNLPVVWIKAIEGNKNVKDEKEKIKKVQTIPKIKILDEEFLKEFPYFNKTIMVDEINKLKRRGTIMLEITKQMPSDNDKYFLQYNPENGTCLIGKDEQLVVISDDEKKPKKEQKKKNTLYIRRFKTNFSKTQ